MAYPQTVLSAVLLPALLRALPPVLPQPAIAVQLTQQLKMEGLDPSVCPILYYPKLAGESWMP